MYLLDILKAAGALVTTVQKLFETLWYWREENKRSVKHSFARVAEKDTYRPIPWRKSIAIGARDY